MTCAQLNQPTALFFIREPAQQREPASGSHRWQAIPYCENARRRHESTAPPSVKNDKCRLSSEEPTFECRIKHAGEGRQLADHCPMGSAEVGTRCRNSAVRRTNFAGAQGATMPSRHSRGALVPRSTGVDAILLRPSFGLAERLTASRQAPYAFPLHSVPACCRSARSGRVQA